MKYLLIIFALTFVACNSKKEEETKDEIQVTETTVTLTEQQLKNAGIATAMAEQRTIKSIVNVKGKIDVPPQNMVSVSFPLGGYLKSTRLMSGMHVSKGEVIATMEDQQYIQLQQEYLTAVARSQYLENEFLRQKELNKSKASSDKIYQQAEADYRSNKILVGGLKQKLLLIGINPDMLNETNISRTISVRSPIDGFVSAVNVNIGKYVTPSDVLFELVNPKDIHLVLTVFEKDIEKLSVGQKIIAYNYNSPGKRYPCEIILIGKDVGIDRAIEVHCHFDEYDNKLVPGMYMSAEIEVSNANTFAVPEEAVVRFENKQYVFVVVNGKQYEMSEVLTGDVENGYIAIIDAKDTDLASKQVVTKNAYTLLMKLKNKSE